YPGHPLEIQVYAGILTWLSYLIDDKTSESEMKTDVTRFQERFYSGGEQPTCLLRGYAKLLRSTYDHFDNVVANFLILSVLAFVNSNVLENRDEFNSMTPTKGGGKFWWYCRDKSGLAEAYVYLTFHQAHYPDISAFLEAVPDMCIFTNLTNEILSFYKEEKAGERKNYLHNRADCENKEVLDVLREVVEECVEAFQRGQVILHGTEQYAQGWQTFALGLVACHKAIDRYRLSEIGLEEKYDEA
ncbi:isoprenoid synthase domain-containing protein, partial [Mycena epipterygia]